MTEYIDFTDYSQKAIEECRRLNFLGMVEPDDCEYYWRRKDDHEKAALEFLHGVR